MLISLFSSILFISLHFCSVSFLTLLSGVILIQVMLALIFCISKTSLLFSTGCFFFLAICSWFVTGIGALFRSSIGAFLFAVLFPRWSAVLFVFGLLFCTVFYIDRQEGCGALFLIMNEKLLAWSTWRGGFPCLCVFSSSFPEWGLPERMECVC